MKLSSKPAGFGIMAVAGLMLCTAAIADTRMGSGPMGHGMMTMPSLTEMDADKDGRVSKDEVATWRKAQAAAIDTNGDGKMSLDELAAMHLKAMTDAAKTMAQVMVDRMDTDGDGMLSAAELVAQPMPTDQFDKLDTNKDGFIDQAELDAAKAMMQRGPGRDGGRDGGRGGRHGDHKMPGANGN